MALSKIQSESVNLSDNFAFTGTVTGAGLSSPFGNTVAVTSEGGAVTTNLVQGLAKAWVNFDGTGTIAIRDSLSVNGLIDNGTGNYTVNFTNAMSSADFASFADGNVNTSNTDIRRTIRLYRTETGLVKICCGNIGGGSTDSKEDWTNVATAVHGDLA